jgi:hypothetical protein
MNDNRSADSQGNSSDKTATEFRSATLSFAYLCIVVNPLDNFYSLQVNL